MDNQNPVITCPSNITQNATNGNCSAVVTFNVSATDNCSATVISNHVSGSTFNVGTTTVINTATDLSGNTASCSFTVTVVDNQNPVITCPSNITQNATNGNCSAVVTFSVTSTDNCTVSTTVSNPASGSTFNVGTTTVHSTATDIYGNTASCSFTVTVVDNQSPVITCPSNITQVNDAGLCSAVVTFSVTSTDNCTVSTTVSNPASGSTFNVGITTVISTATDIYGNTSSCSFLVKVFDTESPVITCPSNITQNTDGGLCSAVVTFSVTGTDNCGVSTTVSNPASGSTFNAGTTTVNSIATDIHGNTSTCSFTVKVVDNQSPVISCPSNITQNTDGGLCSAVVTFSVTGTDNCGVSAVVSSPGSGSTFAVGTTTVTGTATDLSGNTSSCSFTVTVADNEFPVAVCQAVTVELDNSGNSVIQASDIDGGSTDNCGIASMAVSPNSFTCSNVGANTVTLTVTDLSGNTSSCSTAVTVQDNTAPAAVCLSITVQLDNSGNASIQSGDVDGGSTDACGIGSESVSPNTFNCSNTGDNTVTLTVTDVNGNSSSCSSTVSIADTIVPIALCQAITIYLDNTGNAGIQSSDVDGGSFDNCDLSALDVAPNSFTCSNVGDNTVTLTVTDMSGNVSTCSTTVTVQDITFPVVICQPVTVQLDNSGNGGIQVSDIDGGSYDNCGIATESVSPNVFNCSNTGDNTVTLTVTDVNGNISTCSTTVTVQDNTAPTSICSTITVQLDNSGNGGIQVSDIDGGSYDNCGIGTESVSPNTFTCSNTGANTVTLTVTDINGNSSSCSAAVTVADTIAPIALCQGITIQLDNTGNAVIQASDVDGGSFDNCNLATLAVTPNTFTCSNAGDNTVTLTVTDVNGNSSNCTTTVTVQDTVSPVSICQVITVQLDNSGNAVIQASDVDGGSTDACGISTESVSPNTFTCSNTGDNTVTLTVTDVNGNTSNCTATVTVSDTIAPIALCQAVTIYLDNTGNAGIQASDVDGGSFDNCNLATTDVTPNTFTCGNTGANTVTLTVTDVNGNSSYCTTTVTVEDTITPSAVCQAITVTLDNTGNATITAGDVDGGSSDNCSFTMSVIPNSFTYGNQGSNTVTLTVTDGSGNTSSCSTTVTVQDTTHPVAVCQSITVQLDNSGTASIQASDVDGGSTDGCGIVSETVSESTFTCSNVGLNTVTLTVFDNCGNSASCAAAVTVQDNMPPTAICQGITVQLDNSGHASIQSSDVDGGSTDNCGIGGETVAPNTFNCANVGNTTVTLTVTDVNSNVSTCSAVVTVADNTAPAASCQAVTVQLDNSGNAVIQSSDVDNGSSDNCGIGSETVSPNTFSCSSIGDNTVTLTVTDLSGNSSSCSSTVTVQDNIAPIALCLSVTVQLDNSGHAGISVTDVDGGSFDNCSIASESVSPGTFTCSNTGDNTVTLTVTDESGNTSGCTSTITVVDTQAPVLTCSGNMTRNADNGNCSAVVTFSVTATDNCSVTVVSGPASGSTFAVGTTTVTSTATDNSGNTSTCSFTVTVTDNQNPVITCSGTITQSTDNGNCSAVVTFSVTATDNCAVSTVVSNPASGSTFNTGTTTVNSIATDIYGNTSTCSFSVTVTDNQNPVVTCTGNATRTMDNNACSYTTQGSEFDAAASDNCTLSSLVNSLTNTGTLGGYVFTTGMTTVNWTATDNSGNTSTCSMTVTVVDNQAPAISCPSNITVNGNINNCTAVVSFSVTATDNCGVSGVVSNPASGSTFTTGTTTVNSIATDIHGNTGSCSFTVTVLSVPPVQPGLITGNMTVCHGSIQTYSIAAVAGATSYTWTLPNGWTGSSTTTSITTTAGTISGNVTVTANNGCGSSASQTLAVVVDNAVPVQPGVITGSTPVCQGSTQTYSIAAVAGATGYTWTLPGGWIGSSTTTSITVTVGLNGGTISVIAVNACGNSVARTFAVVVSHVPATPGMITGATTVCQGSTQTYSITAVAGATSYTWTLPNGWTGSSTTNSITVTVGINSGTISVTANNGCGSSAARTLAVTVTTIPNQPLVITGNASPCQGSTQTYTIAAVAGATGYTWTLPNGWTGSSTTTSITVTVGANSGTISVTANNGCGSSTAQTLTVTVSTVPAQPGVITGNTTVCQGSVQTYTITAVAGATGYTWIIPGGWSGSSTTTSITVTVGVNSGNISVTANNGCGSSVARTLALTVMHIPAQPGAISGNTTVCLGSVQTYSITAVAGATSYSWTLPGGWTGSSTTNSITVTAGATSGTISVTANNGCGSSAARTLAVTVITVPAEPSVIAGSSTPCQGSTQTYSVSNVAGLNYTWTLPGGWTGSSTTHSITVTVGATSGTISVTANNGCGSSVARTLTVTVNTVPLQPGPITGNTTVCLGSTQTYSIAAVTGATGYSWTLPGGWSGSSTTTSITVTAGANGGTISVTANNACGSSAAQTLVVTVMTVPVQPGSITGTTPICSGSSATYSVSPVAGATSYSWTLPNGWTGSSTVDSIVATSGGTGSFTISVTANNSCGSSAAQTYGVTVITSPATPGVITGSTSVCAGTPQTYSIAAVTYATGYVWTLPNGWTGSSTTTSIMTTAGTTSGNVSVIAVNQCGISPTTRILAVTVGAPPGNPGTITGNTAPCSGTSQTYSIAAVSGATGYTWVLPTGWPGSSTTTSITSSSIGTTSGYVKVQATNSCGTSLWDSVQVTVGTAPAQPGTITGPVQVCQGSAVSYSISPVAGATSYAWTKPVGWTGASVTTNITLTVSQNTGNVTVSSVNSCGTSPSRTLTVTNVAVLAITGNPASFNFCTQNAPTFEVLMATNGFNAYAWSPSGGSTATATVSSAGTYTISATKTAYGCTAIKTQGVTNNCAAPTALSNGTITSSTAIVNWVQSQCRVNYTLRISPHGLNTWTTYTIAGTLTSYTFTGLTTGTSYDWQILTDCNSSGTITSAWVSGPMITTLSPRLGDGLPDMSFNVYPNPADGQVMVSFTTMEEGSYTVRLVDMFGRVVKNEVDNAGAGDNIHVMNLDGLAKGVYIIELEKGSQVNKTRLVIQ